MKTSRPSSKVELFRSFFGRIEDTKKSFWIQLTFNGHTSVSELLVKNMRDKNPADVSFWTPLHLAAEFGHLAVCELLIENVWEGLEDDYGETPFQLAAQNGHLSVCQLFIDCSFEVKGYKGSNSIQAPLHFAAKNGQLEVWKIILKHVWD